MIIKPSKQVIEALARLDGNQSFEVVMSWIEESMAVTVEAMKSERSDTDLRWQQGAATDLSEIVELSRKARSLIR